LADIGSAIEAEALRGFYGAGPFDSTLPAQPGPPTGVKAFAPGEGTPGAYLAKLGARIFQRARERAAYKTKLSQLALNDQYKRAQIEHLQSLTSHQDEPTYTVDLDGQKFSGLKGGEAARLVAARDRAKGGTIDADPMTGKPLPMPMKVSEWLTWRGQNMTSGRAAAARELQEKLATNRQATADEGLKLREASAALSAIHEPTEQELFARAGAVAQDSLARAGVKRPSKSKIQDLQVKLYPYVSRAVRDSLASRRDSLARNIDASSLRMQPLSDQAKSIIDAIQAQIESPGP